MNEICIRMEQAAVVAVKQKAQAAAGKYVGASPRSLFHVSGRLCGISRNRATEMRERRERGLGRGNVGTMVPSPQGCSTARVAQRLTFQGIAYIVGVSNVDLQTVVLCPQIP